MPRATAVMLSVLGDGDWHDVRELYALGVLAHSRVAELRARGFVIEQCGDRYRLLATSDGALV